VHNVAAANLRANTSNLIGLILRDFSDSFSIKVMASIVQELERKGYMVFLGSRWMIMSTWNAACSL
jgi:LacI family transcriptional regulator of maltose regulon